MSDNGSKVTHPKKKWKIVVLVLVVVLGLIIGGVSFCVQVFKSMTPELAEMGKAEMSAGTEFGKKHSASECVQEAISKDAECDGFLCHVGSRIFLKTCLSGHQRSPELCEGVPTRTEILSSVKWALSFCSQSGHPDAEDCARVIRPFQEYCNEP